MRSGWDGKAETTHLTSWSSWKPDFNLDKNNTDRGANKGGLQPEKYDDLGNAPAKISALKNWTSATISVPFVFTTGWTTRWLDIHDGWSWCTVMTTPTSD